jgi:NDP-sugar pyrophosphorylase family protein
MKVRKAVFPAAGLGTRFLPATKAQPKEMLPLVDKPIIQYVVEEAVAAGLEEIILVTGHNKRVVAGLVAGMALSVVFQVAHCLEEAEFPLPTAIAGRIDNAWAVHQVETTVDFARRSRVVT